jgi:hypothetical protein
MERTKFETAWKSSKAGVDRPRRLILCLDGVPFDIVTRARERGLFDSFHETSRLLSPFPTMTNIALSTMFSASPPLGYESRYFNRDTRSLQGGISKYIGRRTPDKVPSTYMDQLDYQEPLPFEYLVYVAPEAVLRADMRRFRERFGEAPQDRDYVAFIKGTDGLLHIRGPRRLELALESLDRLLTEIRSFCGDETEIVLFSDHGMTIGRVERVHLQTHLKCCGYILADQLSHGNGRAVSLPTFGLIGYAALYCNEDLVEKLADDIIGLEGVDFAISKTGSNSLRVTGGKGVAIITRKSGESDSYKYEQISGDPLMLSGASQRLSQRNAFDQEGFAPDNLWFEQVATHIYPDALSNLFDSLYSPRVGHNADVLVSIKDGYYYGSSFFSQLVTLEATHGNAMQSSTNAFIMSTHRALPAAVRGSNAWKYLAGNGV